MTKITRKVAARFIHLFEAKSPKGEPPVEVQRVCSTALPPLQGELKEIMGMMLFNTGGIGRRLDQLGLYKVPRKAEEEQAAALHWMINLYLEHGDKWRSIGEKILRDDDAQ